MRFCLFLPLDFFFDGFQFFAGILDSYRLGIDGFESYRAIGTIGKATLRARELLRILQAQPVTSRTTHGTGCESPKVFTSLDQKGDQKPSQ